MSGLLTAIGFGAPWLLLGLLALPVLYWLLRATPPAPIIRKLAAITLLLGLDNTQNTPDRTPWWLLLLRLIAIAALIIGFADPIINPKQNATGSGRMVIALDASWASAQSWNARRQKLDQLMTQAARDGRPVAIANLSEPPPDTLLFQTAHVARQYLASIEPVAWAPDYRAWQDNLQLAPNDQLIWFSDGVAHPDKAAFATQYRTQLQVIEPQNPIFALRALQQVDGILQTEVLAINQNDPPLSVELRGIGPDGANQTLARQDITLDSDRKSVDFDLPSELRNRITAVALGGIKSAGAIAYTDDGVKRQKIALLAGSESQEAENLLAPLHYLRTALAPNADLIEMDLSAALSAKPDVMIFADIGRLPPAQAQAVEDWVQSGGLLIRFAGPRLANSGIAQREFDPLIPVLLRKGGRDLGGMMSWGEPKHLQPFDRESPFFGLSIPDDVRINAQVLAQPHPDLSDRVLARLADGTPLISAYDLGAGRVVLFHITANAQWSNLPLSGLFVKMLERLSVFANRDVTSDVQLIGQTWVPSAVMDGFGYLQPTQNLPGVDGQVLASAPLSAALPAGIYENDKRRVALNVSDRMDALRAMTWPENIPVDRLVQSSAISLKPHLLMLALVLLLLDVAISLAISGRMVAALLLVLIYVPYNATPSWAQSDVDLSLLAANHTVLAHVLTGDPRVDQTAAAGLRGLSNALSKRTSIEPIDPIGIDLDQDDISALPFLYWPMSTDQPALSDAVIDKVNRYLRRGGMIMFDTRDAHLQGVGGGTTQLSQQLQRVTAGLDIPPLSPIPDDHVLTRTFYLLSHYPGRHFGPAIWVEAPQNETERAEGMPFRNLNDGVTPVIIGANDWAAAWAIDEQERPIFPVGQGAAGEKQREFALRFGVNVIMYVMSGNYKSDQVHVPALLDRLGQ